VRTLAILLLLLSSPAAANLVFDAQRISTLPAPRAGMAVAAANGRIYCFGGTTGETAHADAWCFDVATRAWRRLPPMDQARGGHAAVVVGERILIFGGMRSVDGAPRFVNAIEAFDLRRERWSTLAIAPFSRANFAALYFGGRVMILGGRTEREVACDRVEIYDPAAGTWSSGLPLPQQLACHAAVAMRDAIFVLGGEGSDGGARAQVFRLAAGGDRWVAAPSLRGPRKLLVAVRMGWRIYAIGGTDGFRGLTDIEWFDRYDEQWHVVGQILQGRHGDGGVLLNGRAWLVGGADGQSLEAAGWRVPLSKWRVDEPLGFHLAFLPSAPPPDSDPIRVPAVGYAPEVEADITNIPMNGVLDLGFPLPAPQRPQDYTCFLKFYRYPNFLDAAASTGRILAPLMVSQPALSFAARPENLVIKEIAIEKTDWGFGRVHPFPPLVLPTKAWRGLTPQEFLDRGVRFSSLYVKPDTEAPPGVSNDDLARHSALGVTAFNEEILALYGESFEKVSASGVPAFLDDSDPLRIRVITPRAPMAFGTWKTLPMPQNPQGIFLSGLLLIRADEYLPGRREPFMSHMFEVGSVVRPR